uniref:Calmodulin-binding transcription activator 1 n=1 Tax=Ciona savignyi TaxID=51511 RepID=H2YF07_CIOSA
MDDPSSPAENSPPPLFPTDGAETRQVDHPMCCGSYFRPKDGNMTLIAEQILESTSNANKASEDLSLRSLPKFVTSRCGSGKNNQPLQRDAESVMNWSEFLQLPPNSRVNENHLNSLRLTDQEHRQLNFAAKTVLLAYNKDRLTFSGHELRASLLIQHCYRKFHMFATCKKMNEAAVLIQSKFRSYQEQKRFQRSRHAAILIQSFYRSYKHTRTFEKCTDQPSSVQLIEEALRCHLTKRKQHQAARKIQRFLRRCHYRQHEGDHISPHERFTC